MMSPPMCVLIEVYDSHYLHAITYLLVSIYFYVVILKGPKGRYCTEGVLMHFYFLFHHKLQTEYGPTGEYSPFLLTY